MLLLLYFALSLLLLLLLLSAGRYDRYLLVLLISLILVSLLGAKMYSSIIGTTMYARATTNQQAGRCCQKSGTTDDDCSLSISFIWGLDYHFGEIETTVISGRSPAPFFCSCLASHKKQRCAFV